MRLSFPRRVRLAALVVFVLVLAAGGIGYASIPDGTGLVHACYTKRDGALRVIDSDAGGTCNTTKENPLNWNQTGPQGPPGPSGPGAESFDAVVPAGSGISEVLTLDDQLKFFAVCSETGVGIQLEAADGTNLISVFGWVDRTDNNGVPTFDTFAISFVDDVAFNGSQRVQLHVTARRVPGGGGTPGPYYEIDLVIHRATPCTVSGMTTPST